MKKVFIPFFAICLALVLSFAGNRSEAAPVKAPAFAATTVDGRPFASSALKGKAYIVNFFATWCPPCRAEIPEMVALQKAYAAKGFTFVGVAVNSSAADVRELMRSNGINYPVVMGTPALSSAFGRYVQGGFSGIPTSFVVNSSGELTGVIVGARSKAEFERIIIAALGRKPF